MIFKTFDNDIDKWTAKIGILGKSFNELGTAVNKSFESVINNLDEDVGFGESLKNNLFNKKDGDKDWKKNSHGEIISEENIDSYIKEIDLDSAKEKLHEVFNWQKEIKNGSTTWEDYFDTCKNGNEYLIDIIKNTDDLSKLTSDDLIQANQKARKAALDHNVALKQQTLGAKAASAGMKALSIAGNLVAGFAVAKGIEWVATSISNYVNASYIAKEKTEALSSSLSEAQSKYAEDSKKIGELSSRYETLSKGVNHLGQNVSLSSSQYDEYKSVIRQLSDIMPDLTLRSDEIPSNLTDGNLMVKSISYKQIHFM